MRTNRTEEEAEKSGEVACAVSYVWAVSHTPGRRIQALWLLLSRLSVPLYLSVKHYLTGGLGWPQTRLVLSVSIFRKIFRYSSLSSLEPVGDPFLAVLCGIARPRLESPCFVIHRILCVQCHCCPCGPCYRCLICLRVTGSSSAEVDLIFTVSIFLFPFFFFLRKITL